MSEQRWRKSNMSGWTPTPEPNSVLVDGVYCVLQYRVGDWTASSNPADPDIEWTEWQDVKISYD